VANIIEYYVYAVYLLYLIYLRINVIFVYIFIREA